MSRESLKDNIAKAIADAAGHGMREKCERHADAVLDVLAQRDAHLSAQAQVLDDTASFKNFHRSLCERFGYMHDDVHWRRDLVSLEEHIANVSAQAKVRVTDETHARSVWMQRAVEAARLSQGAQGEVAKLDKPALVGHTQFGIGIAWATVIGAAQRAYEWKDDKMSPEQIAAFYIAFPHLAPSHEKVMQNAERAAVPDDVRRAVLSKDLYAVLMDVQNGIDSPALQAMANRAIIQIDKARGSLTSTTQPPEGARVVPKYARLAYFALCEERAAYEDPLAHVEEAIAALIAEYGAEQLAAPTLAGKEGK